MSFLSGIFPGLFNRNTPTNNALHGFLGDQDRQRKYQKYLRAYIGFSIRAPIGQFIPTEQSRIKHNFNRPIVDLGADYLASKALKWNIDGDDKQKTLGTTAANIWDRSGSDRAFLESARCAGIYGDVVGLATQDADGRAHIEFVDPNISFPTFDGSDNSKLTSLDISWVSQDRLGQQIRHREFYEDNGRQVFIDGELDEAQSQTWQQIPAVWIRNLSIKGLSFGFSDLEGVAELVEEYDHVAAKRTRIVDVYANPNIVAEGMKAGDIKRDRETVYYTPVGTKMYYLEWTGNQPQIEEQLIRLRDDISEISQVPAVAFGRHDSGISNISGIALRILYGPLLSKTNRKRANWGPPLEYLMCLCLQAEGYDVALEAVNAEWQDPLPADPLQQAQSEASNVQAGLVAVPTAMGRMGIEDPAGEYTNVEREKRFERLAQLANAKELAGVPPDKLAVLCGFTPEEAKVLEVVEPPPVQQPAGLILPPGLQPSGVVPSNGRMGVANG